MDTQTQIERLIELAIVQRTELKQLVEQLPSLREHLNAEVERTIEEVEPQLRAELEEFCDKRANDANAKVGSALEAKIIELSKNLELTTQARYNAIKEQERKVEELRELAAKQIEGHVATLPEAVKEMVGAELARFPRAGEIDQLRKEFAEPKGLNPRGKWLPSETYNRLDLVTYNGDSFTSAIDGNRSRPSRNAAEWTLIAARGTGGGGPTSLSELTTVPSNGDLLIGSGTSWVTSNLTAGAGISITVGAGEITISATDGDITLDDGTAASPSLHFTNDPDTGIYRPAANTLGISVSGTQVAYFDENGLTIPNAGVVAGGSIHASNGNANNPSHSFSSDTDTGFYRHATNQIGVSTSGTASLVFTDKAGELLGHTGVSVTFGAGSSGATIALGQGSNGGVTITSKGSGTAVVNGTTIPASKTLVVTTDKLSALASTSSSELAGVISDETGTGSLVFANTPTLVTPNIGAATGTSLTTTGNLTASDLIIGTSGPSAKSSIAARAARQGLVFDGTAGSGATLSSAIGTSDVTFATWMDIPASNPSSLRVAYYVASGAAWRPNDAACYLNTDGTLGFQLRGTLVGDTRAATVTANAVSNFGGKRILFTVRRTGTTLAIEINGVSQAFTTVGSAITWANTIDGTTVRVGDISNNANPFVGYLAPLIYNRALSAAEVVALYEAGVPAAADYPGTAAGTTLNTSAWVNSNYSTFTSASGSSLSGVYSGSGTQYGYAAPTFVSKYGNTIRFFYDLTLTSGQAPYVILTQIGVKSCSAPVTLTAGTGKYVDLVVTDPSSATTIAINNTSASNWSIANARLTPIGLLLAPDAGQAGGGLTWYDTSGNAANITLPATGVSWNVPFAGYLTAPASTNLTLNGGSSGASLVLGQGTSGGSTLTAVGTGGFTFTQSGNNSQANTTFNSGGAIGVGFDFKRTTASASPGIGLFQLNGYNGSTRSAILEANSDGATDSARFDFWVKATGGSLTQGMILKSNGNLLVGGTADGGQKLQVAGTGLFTSDVTLNGATASPTLSIRGANANASPIIYLTSGFGGGSQQQWSIYTNDASAGGFLIRDNTAGSNLLTIAKSTGVVSLASTTASTSTTTGALVVSGGVGVGGKMYVGDELHSQWTLFMDRAAQADIKVSTASAPFNIKNSADTNVLNIDTATGNGTFAGWIAIKDGSTAPSATSGTAKIYVDTADGDLKVIFGDGTVKTIVVDS